MKKLLTTAGSIASIAVMASEKPNVLFIMTDQQSYNTISALADIYPESYSKSPNLDRLVNGGFTLTHTYAANPLSVPSRFALFTGHYGSVYKVLENSSAAAHGGLVREMLQTYGMGNIFKKAGYETYYAGKVHLPFASDNTNSNSMFAAPTSYGFTHYVTNDDRQICAMETANFLSNRNSTTPFLYVASFMNPHDICYESSTNLSSVVDMEGNPEAALVVKEARDVIASYDPDEFYDKIAPQLPYNFELTENFPTNIGIIGKDYPEDYWRRYRWTYAWMVERVDRQIGIVLDALEASDFADNTIVIFTSDHGEMQGAHHGTTKPIPYEEAQRVPFIIWGKGIQKGVRCDALACNGTDLIPTMCDLVDIEYPQLWYGRSFAAVAQGTASAPQRTHLYTEGRDFRSLHEGKVYKYSYFEKETVTPQNILIDMAKDYGEMVNIADQKSEKMQELIQIMQKIKQGLAQDAADAGGEMKSEVLFEEGFEKTDGFPATFSAVGGNAWEKNGYTGELWNLIYTSTANENKVYAASITSNNVLSGNQCMKFTIPARSFTPKSGSTPSAIRLRSVSDLLDLSQGNIGLSCWARVDGTKALSVVKSGKSTVKIATEWCEYTIKSAAISSNGEILIDFIPLSTTDFSTKNDYTVYFDNLQIIQDKIAMGSSTIEKEQDQFYYSKQTLHFHAPEHIKLVQLFNVHGQCLYTTQAVNKTLRLEGLQQGFYIVKAQTLVGELQVKKIML